MSRGRFTVLRSVCRTHPFKNPRKPYPVPTNPYRTFPSANNYLITTVPTLRNPTLKPVQALRNFCTESPIPPPVDDIAKEIQEILNDFTQAEIAASEKVIEEEEESESDEEGEAIGEEDGSTRDVSSLDPTALFQEMEESKRLLKMTKQNKESYLKILTHFEHSGWVKDQALGLYINASFFPSAAANFRKYFRLKCHSDVMRYLLDSEPGDTMNRFIFPIFAEFCLARYRKEMEKFREMVQSADMRRPHTWYPFARAMKRKIVYHCGPTNSGKTYNALQRMMEAKSGIYCGPLRLLAMEVFDKVNSQGVYCSLHTGQEKKDVPFAKHISCTVEMMNTNQCWDVAVIDEIQMIGDEFRGYAWSRALLGLLADEIHICGDPSVLHLVKHICASTGDFLDIRYYPRFKPLVVERSSLVGNFTNIQKGDCIVAFSRREIFEIKLAVEKFTKHKCCVIYGGLPPETRKRQATLFNDPSSGYDVLVASDAVGMGLNLNIKRVVFYGLMKYNGDKMQRVQASQVKQIAGRAGRRGSIYSDGRSTTFQQEDMEYLIECLKSPFQVTRKAGLFPCFEQLELFAGKLPDIAFTQLLDRFSEHCRLDGHFFLCRHDNIKKLANMLARIPGLSLEDRFNFCFAPVNVRDPKALMHLQKFASDYSRSVPVGIAMGMPKRHAQSDTELLDLESRHQVLSMYLWLAQHFERDRFPYTEKALTMATDIELLLGVSLAKAKWKPDPKKGSKKGDEGKPKRDSDEASKGDPEGLTKRDPEGLTKRDPDEAHIHESVARQLVNLRKRLKEKVPS